MTTRNNLTAIRQSHRYVVAYQRRLLDALSALNNQLLDIGFSFDEWDPLHFDRPPVKSNSAILNNRWAFDFLMLYSVSFYWEKGEENKPGYVCFQLEHLADTGLEKALELSNDEPDPLTFDNAADSESIVRCFWIAITGKKSPFSDDEWESNGFDELLISHFDKDHMAAFNKIDTPLPLEEFEDKGLVFGQMAVSLEELPDPESFYESFCDVVVGRLKELSPPPVENEEEL